MLLQILGYYDYLLSEVVKYLNILDKCRLSQTCRALNHFIARGPKKYYVHSIVENLGYDIEGFEIYNEILIFKDIEVKLEYYRDYNGTNLYFTGKNYDITILDDLVIETNNSGCNGSIYMSSKHLCIENNQFLIKLCDKDYPIPGLYKIVKFIEKFEVVARPDDFDAGEVLDKIKEFVENMNIRFKKMK